MSGEEARTATKALELRSEGRRVAEVVRSLKRALTTARDSGDVETVVRSLLKGANAFARQDRAELLTNAPAKAPSGWAVLLQPPALGATLIGIAVALHLVHTPDAYHGTANWLANLLLSTGLLLIASSVPELAGRVGDALSKLPAPFR